MQLTAKIELSPAFHEEHLWTVSLTDAAGVVTGSSRDKSGTWILAESELAAIPKSIISAQFPDKDYNQRIIYDGIDVNFALLTESFALEKRIRCPDMSVSPEYAVLLRWCWQGLYEHSGDDYRVQLENIFNYFDWGSPIRSTSTGLRIFGTLLDTDRDELIRSFKAAASLSKPVIDMSNYKGSALKLYPEFKKFFKACQQSIWQVNDSALADMKKADIPESSMRLVDDPNKFYRSKMKVTQSQEQTSSLKQWCIEHEDAKKALDALFRNTDYSFEFDSPHFKNLERAYEVCERAWIRNFFRFRGQPIRYLLIAEAAPWTELSKPTSYFYENLQGEWCKRITRVFGIDAKDPELALIELAPKGFVLLDSLPFAAPYTSRLRKRHEYLELIRACRPYFEDKLSEIGLRTFGKDVKVAFAFKLNGLRLIEIYDHKLPMPNVGPLKITEENIAADGSGYTNVEKLKKIFCLSN